MATALLSFLVALNQIDDPRKARGDSHPFTSLFALTFLSLLCHETDFTSLHRWAQGQRKVFKNGLHSIKDRWWARIASEHARGLSRTADLAA